MAATYLIDLDGKKYEFNPGKQITLVEYEYMEAAYGPEYGGWFGFRDQLTKYGNHKSVRCLIWLIQRHFEGFLGSDPRRVDLPTDFEPGQFLEDIRDKDILDALTAEEVTSGPLETAIQTDSTSSTPDGSEQSESSEES